jgi:lysophospholipase L1-like esterase
MKRFVLLIVLVIASSSFSKKQLTWVAIGDSITYLNEHTAETGSRITKGYMTRVVEKLPRIHYDNKGFNGWTSGGIAGKIDELGLVNSDVYSIFLGTNDWWQGRPIGTLEDYKSNTGNNTVFASYRIIINKLRSLNKSATIILITPMQRNDFVYINDYKNMAYGSYKEKNGQSLEQFADAISSIGKYEHLRVVDLFHKKGLGVEKMVKFKRLKDPTTGQYKNYKYPDFVNIPFHPETDEYPYPVDATDMSYDGLHPSDKGYAVIANMLVKVMRKL